MLTPCVPRLWLFPTYAVLRKRFVLDISQLTLMNDDWAHQQLYAFFAEALVTGALHFYAPLFEDY